MWREVRPGTSLELPRIVVGPPCEVHCPEHPILCLVEAMHKSDQFPNHTDHPHTSPLGNPKMWITTFGLICLLERCRVMMFFAHRRSLLLLSLTATPAAVCCPRRRSSKPLQLTQKSLAHSSLHTLPPGFPLLQQLVAPFPFALDDGQTAFRLLRV